MAFAAFKQLFNEAGYAGSRSTALRPVHWMTGIVFLTLVSGFHVGFPAWLLITVCVAAMVCVAVFVYSYLFLLRKNPDALRSETYSLHKIAIEKGMIGDSIQGAFAQGEEDDQGLLPHDSKDGNDDET